MSKFICLDTSVLVKVFFEEQDSSKAVFLMQNIIEKNQIIILPSFAWAEMGSIIRKKIRSKQITFQDGEEIWTNYTNFPGIEYLEGDSIIHRAWKISCSFDMPTLYDAAFLAVSEEIREKTKKTCELWTADEKLINSLRGKKQYVKSIKELQ
ncbi:type II toxin-antitoxin system VapC family toxin [Candidatus Contubernalis alkaliaceticus]|uniref:type II toxin-antitoxin system VapC family toxin n=1 Tax=Candidatus Contubernalis alkaliaceticus TaxID=338645 RepID=UPI001F4BDAEB|nr:type II toxin-antitoxin system VapC family toxin [Candidatus Contubernalis alkalaceticus]UNC92105.1 type II toxin-antitoxin system VapC family toxin [Candidatus Contubernalis alkalaceticus]